MNLASLSSIQFKQIAGLLEQKEALQAQIDLINQKLAAFEGGAPATVAAPVAPVAVKAVVGGKAKRSPEARAKMAAAQKARWAKKKGVVVAAAPTPKAVAPAAAAPVAVKAVVARKGGKSKRGATKERIIELVKGAGKGGIGVGELAAKLGVKYNNAYVWFATTGKKVKEIKKVGKAQYAWVA